MQNRRSTLNRMAATPLFKDAVLRRLSLALMWGSATAFLLVGDRIYTAHHPPEPEYFFTDSHANLIKATPMNRPVMSDADLMDWTRTSTLSVFNFNYVHYREELSRNAQPNFTINGWNSWFVALQKAKIIESVVEAGLTVSAWPLKGPTMKKAWEGRVLTWDFRFPAAITYHNVKGDREVKVMLEVTVTRVPTSMNPKGVAIDNIVAHLI